MDANKDGIITVDELASVFKKVDKSMQRQDIEHIIKMADTNEDGGLSMFAASLAVLFGFLNVARCPVLSQTSTN